MLLLEVLITFNDWWILYYYLAQTSLQCLVSLCVSSKVFWPAKQSWKHNQVFSCYFHYCFLPGWTSTAARVFSLMCFTFTFKFLLRPPQKDTRGKSIKQTNRGFLVCGKQKAYCQFKQWAEVQIITKFMIKDNNHHHHASVWLFFWHHGKFYPNRIAT